MHDKFFGRNGDESNSGLSAARDPLGRCSKVPIAPRTCEHFAFWPSTISASLTLLRHTRMKSSSCRSSHVRRTTVIPRVRGEQQLGGCEKERARREPIPPTQIGYLYRYIVLVVY